MLDAIIEELVHARGPAGRAATIVELVQEMCATVEWLQATGTEPDDAQADEVRSIARLSRAARDHQRQLGAATGHRR